LRREKGDRRQKKKLRSEDRAERRGRNEREQGRGKREEK
jgi:hypothetical protein